MVLTVQRTEFTAISTMGSMYLDGEFFLFTLELPSVDGLPGSAIPAGTYKVIPYNSPHFGRTMPLIIGIPNRSEIEIHYGNFADESRGCIMVGTTQSQDFIGNSRIAFDALWNKIQEALLAGQVSIAIAGGVTLPPQ